MGLSLNTIWRVFVCIPRIQSTTSRRPGDADAGRTDNRWTNATITKAGDGRRRPDLVEHRRFPTKSQLINGSSFADYRGEIDPKLKRTYNDRTGQFNKSGPVELLEVPTGTEAEILENLMDQFTLDHQDAQFLSITSDAVLMKHLYNFAKKKDGIIVRCDDLAVGMDEKGEVIVVHPNQVDGKSTQEGQLNFHQQLRAAFNLATAVDVESPDHQTGAVQSPTFEELVPDESALDPVSLTAVTTDAESVISADLFSQEKQAKIDGMTGRVKVETLRELWENAVKANSFKPPQF